MGWFRNIFKREAPPGLITTGSVMPAFNTFGRDARSQMEAYQGWVYKCIQFRAREVGNAKYKVGTFSDGEFNEKPNHIINAILNNPNPFEPGGYFLQRAHTHLDLTGNCYILIVRNGLSKPAELWLLDPRYVKVVPDKQGIISHYEYRVGEKLFKFPHQDVLHPKYPNPGDFFYGMSPLQACALEYEIDLTSKQYQKSVLENAGVPPHYVFEIEGSASSETIEALRHELMVNHTGSRAGSPFIAQGGAKFKPFSLSPQELDFMASRKLTRDDITTIYGVPSSIFGITEDVNRANAEANHYTVARYTIQPIIDLWAQWLTYDMARQYGKDIVVVGENIVPEDRQQDREDMKARIDSGVTSINEERTKTGLKPMKGGDVPTMQSGRIHITQLGLTQGTQKAHIEEKAASTYWKRVNALADRAEARIKRRMQNYFVSLAGAVVPNIVGVLQALGKKQFSETIVLPDKNVWDQLLEEIGLDEIEVTMKDAWNFSMSTIGGTIAYNLTSDYVRSVMRQALSHMKDVNETTINDLVDELEKGIGENETLDALMKRVSDVFKDATRNRALTIARTTSTQAVNSGLRENWRREKDLVKNLVWISSRDGRVRDGHSAADGQTIEQNGFFVVNGEQLQYPGDPAGSAGNVINCRCFIAPLK